MQQRKHEATCHQMAMRNSNAKVMQVMPRLVAGSTLLLLLLLLLLLHHHHHLLPMLFLLLLYLCVLWQQRRRRLGLISAAVYLWDAVQVSGTNL